MEGKEEKVMMVMMMMIVVVDSNPTYPERSSSLVSDSDSVEGTVDVCGDGAGGCVEKRGMQKEERRGAKTVTAQEMVKVTCAQLSLDRQSRCDGKDLEWGGSFRGCISSECSKKRRCGY